MKTDNSIVVAGLIALAVRTEASTGYLPVLGPSPIYFRLPRAVGATFALPPLDMGRPPANPENLAKDSADSADSASWAPPPVPNDTTAEISSKSPPPGPSVQPPRAPAPNPGVGHANIGEQPDPQFLLPLSTQALIPFFSRQSNGGTNASKVTVVLPVEFHPALPPAVPRSSTATFTEDKK